MNEKCLKNIFLATHKQIVDPTFLSCQEIDSFPVTILQLQLGLYVFKLKAAFLRHWLSTSASIAFHPLCVAIDATFLSAFSELVAVLFPRQNTELEFPTFEPILSWLLFDDQTTKANG